MSVAFMKEESAETAAETLLPDRPISPHPNLVTHAGLEHLKRQLTEAQAAYQASTTIEDINERRRQAAAPLRDIRYLERRIQTAQLVPDPANTDIVSFGSTITFSREDGKIQTYRIVGEDEADPKTGSISYVSPIARQFLGKSAGTVAVVSGHELELISISLEAAAP